MVATLTDWLDLGLRWLHVVAGIAWIGASFYFIRLDIALRPPREQSDADKGVSGEFWGVHGGGFYHSQKYRVAPERLPEPLHWFKWEAYTTWLSGFALLVVLYYFHADVRLVDPEVADLKTWEAVAISVGALAVGWLVYDGLCRTLGRRSEMGLAIALAALVSAAAWALGELFASRAAYLHVGAVIGTIMAANVFLVIIPAHRELVAAKEAGREPDPTPGIEAKRRSVHNNYLTLPVVFTMLAGHFPFTYGHEHAWLILVAIMLIAAWLRHFFNLWHVGRRAWLIPATSLLAFVALAVAVEADDPPRASSVPDVRFTRVAEIVEGRCAPCHSQTPTSPGVGSPPAGVVFDTPAQIATRAREIEQQAVRLRTMPPGNVTGMTQAERDQLGAWVQQGAETE